MNVLEYFDQAFEEPETGEAFVEHYNKLFPDHTITLEEAVVSYQTLQAEPELDTDLSCYIYWEDPENWRKRDGSEIEHDGYFNVVGLDDEGEHYSIDLVPWGEWKAMEVTTDTPMPFLDTLSYVYHDLTWMGLPEEQAKKRQEIASMMESINTSETIEVAPGILVSPAVAAQMEKDGDLNELIRGMTFHQVVGKGERVRMFAEEEDEKDT